MPPKKPAPFYQKVYAVVRCIPPGKVTSYGRVAAMLDSPGAARQVGYAMSNLRNLADDPAYQDVPWQRVLGHDGKIVIKGPGEGKFQQAELLEDEGIDILPGLRVDMEKYLWEGLLPHEVEDVTEGL